MVRRMQEFGGDIDYDAWAETMDPNVYGVMRATKALLPLLLLPEHMKLTHIDIGSHGSVGWVQKTTAAVRPLVEHERTETFWVGSS